MSMLNHPSHIVNDAALRFWAWLSVHRKTKILLMVLAVCSLCQFVNTTQATAADDGDSSNATYGLPLSKTTDTHGVSLGKYSELPIDNGNLTHPKRSARSSVISFLWSGYTFVVYLLIALTKYILEFSWLDWLASPVILVANSLNTVLDRTGLAVFGLTVTALVVAVCWVVGRRATAIVTFFVAALFFALAQTPMGNPSTQIQSWVSQAAHYGKDAGNATISQGDGDTSYGDPVSGALVDLTVRNPALAISFGSEFPDKCDKAFDKAAKSDNDAEKIRKDVNKCDDAVKNANETDSYGFLVYYAQAGLSTLGVMCLLGVADFFILKESVMALLGAIGTLAKSHFAAYPGMQSVFLNSLFMVLLNVSLIGVYIWFLGMYLWGIGAVADAMGAGMILMNSLIFGLAVLILAICFLIMKARGKKLSKFLANKLGSFGAGQRAQLKPTRMERAKQMTTSSATQGGKRLARHGARRVIRHQVAKRGVQATAAAATGGATLAGQAAFMAGGLAAENLMMRRRGGKPAASGGFRDADPASHLRDESGAVPMGGPSPNRAGSGLAKTSEQGPAPTPAQAAPVHTEPTAAETGQPNTAPAPTPNSGNLTPRASTPNRSALATTPVGTGPVSAGPSGQAETGPKQGQPVAPVVPPVENPGPSSPLPQSGVKRRTGTLENSASRTEPVQRQAASRAGQYGTLRVHRNGRITPVVAGELVEEVPSTATRMHRRGGVYTTAPSRMRRSTSGGGNNAA
jgi:hypothetical protein